MATGGSGGQDEAPRKRGRPPDLENRRALLAATREILAEVGYASLTMDAVATRAGLYRRLIYRTWDGKVELAKEALFGDLPRLPIPDTGCAREDVRIYVQQMVEITCRKENLNGLPGLQVDLQADAKQAQAVLEDYVYPTIDSLTTIIERGRERGEVTGSLRPSVVMMIIIGSVQLLARTGVVGADELVDTVTALLFDGVIES